MWVIIMMVQVMGMKIVVEGVEIIGQFEFLWEVGCDEFQGYLFMWLLELMVVQDFVCENVCCYGECVFWFL